MKTTILITGISSEIMLRVVSKIDLSAFEIIGVTRNPELLNLPGIKIIKCDLASETSSLSPLLKDCDIIIHAAAITHAANAEKYFKVNLHSTQALANAAKYNHVKHFIFISTHCAGDNCGDYGKSKFQAENYLTENFHFSTILRISDIFGTTKKSGIQKLLNNILEHRIIFYPTSIPTAFFPVHLDNVADVILNQINKSPLNEIINVHGSVGYSYLDLINLVRRLTKKKRLAIPVSKSLLYTLKELLNFFQLDIGIVADQIERLYCAKNHNCSKSYHNTNSNFLSLEKYLVNEVESRSKDNRVD